MTKHETGPIADDPAAARRRPLRLAVVTETYPPEVNGVSLTLRQVVEGLRGRQHDVQLVRPRQAVDATVPSTDVLVPGMPIPRYPGLRMGLPAKGTLVQLWSRQRPDLVHIATEGPLGWSALRAAKALELPVTSDFRTNFHAYSRYYGIGWLHRPIMAYLRGFHNAGAFTMVPTEALKQELARDGLERLVVVSRGVDTLRFGPHRRRSALRTHWGAVDDAPVVLFVGRLAPEKNLPTLARAFQAIRAARPDARFVVVGDGPARADLQAQLPDAVFAGARHGEDLAEHYASADLFVFPSMTETFGNVTTEALASGLGVVAYDHAAAALLIRDGCNGAVAPLADEAAFIDKAVALAIDERRRSVLQRAARETALELGWDRIVAQIEAVFLSAIAADERQATTRFLSARSRPA